MRSSRLVLLGLLNLIAAGAVYYGAWWRVDKDYLYLKLIMTTPLVGVDANTSTSFLVPKRQDADQPQPPPVRQQTETQEPRFHGVTAQTLIPVTAYSWLALATIASCALASAAGAALGSALGSSGRLIALVLALAALAGLGWVGFGVWTEYGMTFPPNHFRAGMGGVILFFVLLGMATARGARGWTRFAAVALILSALGSVAGLYLGTLCGAIKTTEFIVPFLPFLAIVFVIHSLWGWILLPMASRIRH